MIYTHSIIFLWYIVKFHVLVFVFEAILWDCL